MAGVRLSYGCGLLRVLPWLGHSFGSGKSTRLPVDMGMSCIGESHGARKFGFLGPSSRLPDTSTTNRFSFHLAPTLADDGIIEEDDREVLRAIEHMQRVMPLAGLRFSMLQVVVRVFRDEGALQRWRQV